MVFLIGLHYLVDVVLEVFSIEDLGAFDMEVRQIFVLIIFFIIFLVVWEIIEVVLYFIIIKSFNWKDAAIKALSAFLSINLDHFYLFIYKERQVLIVKKEKKFGRKVVKKIYIFIFKWKI